MEVIILFFLPVVFVIILFALFMSNKNGINYKILTRAMEPICMALFPYIFLYIADSRGNNCCGDTAFFSPEHRLTLYFYIIFIVIVYFFSSYRNKTSPPIIEVLINSVLILGIILNIFIAIHIGLEPIIIALGNIPIILLLLMQLVRNHRMFKKEYDIENYVPGSFIQKFSVKILNLKPIYKYSVLFIICLPILVIVTFLLLLFGQKPDSMVKAFTDTYRNGFSQLDHLCEGVVCDEHFLCTVAAKGHKNIVKPIRYGKRGNTKIICNRQLLVSNAFEELLEQKVPRIHRFIRKNYNKVGKFVHKYYKFFNIKLVADIVYIVMKPLEIFFILVLYTFDKKPENRISRQYPDDNY